MSSVAGLTVDPFTGAYAGSKHAVEAFADALDQELAEFGVTVATVNPGPYLTGFNDMMFEGWKSWGSGTAPENAPENAPEKAPSLYDYTRLAFPHEQYDPAEVVDVSVEVLTGRDTMYRHVLPADTVDSVRDQVDAQWSRTLNDGTRPELVDTAFDIEPYTPVQNHG